MVGSERMWEKNIWNRQNPETVPSDRLFCSSILYVSFVENYLFLLAYILLSYFWQYIFVTLHLFFTSDGQQSLQAVKLWDWEYFQSSWSMFIPWMYVMSRIFFSFPAFWTNMYARVHTHTHTHRYTHIATNAFVLSYFNCVKTWGRKWFSGSSFSGLTDSSDCTLNFIYLK